MWTRNGVHRRVVYRCDSDAASCRTAADAIIGRERNRSRCCWIVAAVGVGHRSQRRLVVSDCRRTGQCQHARAAVVVAGDSELVRECEGVLSTHEAGGNRYRRSCQVGVVGIRHSQARIDRHGTSILGVSEIAGCGGYHRSCVRCGHGNRERLYA